MSARRRPNANDRRQSKQSSPNLHVSQRNRPRPKPRQTLSRPEQNRKALVLLRNKPGLRLRQTRNELPRKKPTPKGLAMRPERNNRLPKQKQSGLATRLSNPNKIG